MELKEKIGRASPRVIFVLGGLCRGVELINFRTDTSQVIRAQPVLRHSALH